jgi:hypothetical protein
MGDHSGLYLLLPWWILRKKSLENAGFIFIPFRNLVSFSVHFCYFPMSQETGLYMYMGCLILLKAKLSTFFLYDYTCR